MQSSVGGKYLDNSTNRVFPLVSDGCSATSAKKPDQSTGARNERTGGILLLGNLSIIQCSRATLEPAGTLLIMTYILSINDIRFHSEDGEKSVLQTKRIGVDRQQT